MAKAGWDGWNQVETDDKKSCMSLCLESLLTVDILILPGSPSSCFNVIPNGLSLSLMSLSGKRKKGEEEDDEEEARSTNHDCQVKRSTSVKIDESLRVFNPQFVAFQDEYEEGEYYEEDDGDITGDEKGPQMLLVRSQFGHLMIGHWWCSQPLYFIILYPILPVTVRSRQNWLAVINWHLLNFSSHHTIFGSSSSPFAPEDDGPQESNAWKESLPFCHVVVYQDCTLPLLRKK